MSTLTWGACIYGLALVVSVRVSFLWPQLGVVVRVLACEASGRGFEPHSARVSQTHFKLNILSADIIEYITVKLSIAVKLLQLTLL